MSTEPDYNFNETASPEPAGPSLHLPFALLASALAVVLFAQTVSTFNTRSNLREGRVQLVQGQAQLAEAVRNREPVVKQSAELQKKLQDLVLDLLLLAKTDEDAKAIVAKYNIQQNTPAAGGEAPAPAP
jgi:hypothetical protein